MHDDFCGFAALQHLIGFSPFVDTYFMGNHLISIDFAFAHELQRRLPVVRILAAASVYGQFFLNNFGEVYRYFIFGK